MGGDLLNFCNNLGFPVPENIAHQIILQLLRALKYLHSKGVVHSDVKLENVLLSDNNLESLRLIDFGLSLFTNKNQQTSMGSPSQGGIRGTLNYMAPEILLGTSPMSCPSDIWSTGVMLFTLCCGVMPFSGDTQIDLIHQLTAPEP